MRWFARKGALRLWSVFLLWHVGAFISIRPNMSFGSAGLVGLMLLPGDFVAARLPVVRDYASTFCLVLVLINVLAWHFGFRFAIWLARAIHHPKAGFYGFFIDSAVKNCLS